MFTCIEVKDKQTEDAFIALPRTLYANSKNWICPLEGDIKKGKLAKVITKENSLFVNF